MSKNLSSLSFRQGLTNNLFERLGQAAELEGTPPNEELRKIAEEFLIGTANTFGAASFYDFTKGSNQGKKVYVCNGSACMVAGTQDGVRNTLKEHFSDGEIGEMCCLGRCHENSAFHYNGTNYSARNPAEITEIVSKKNLSGRDNYQVGSLGKSILVSAHKDLERYQQDIQKMLEESPENLIESLKVAQVRGRGGAGFPIWFKLDAVRREKSETKFIVCNADEGDPGAFSDRYLMEQQPYLVLLGMLIAGYAAGAQKGVIYIRAEYPESIEMIDQAIRDLAEANLAGDNILGSDFNFYFKLIKARGAYICGEETALLQSIEGQRAEVRVRPPYPAQEGLFGKPTAVNNVETLAFLPFVLRNGGEAFAKIGTSKSTGTKLISLDSSFHKPGLYEVEMGTPLEQVVSELGGGFKKSVKALHIGGPLGGIVPISKISDLHVDFESFAGEGFLLGHASVIGIPDDYPMIKYLEHLFEFTAHESCGKCFPCRLGSVRGAEMLKLSQDSDYKIDRQLFDDLVETLAKGSLCGLGGGIPLPVRNALKYFQPELSAYFS